MKGNDAVYVCELPRSTFSTGGDSSPSRMKSSREGPLLNLVAKLDLGVARPRTALGAVARRNVRGTEFMEERKPVASM